MYTKNHTTSTIARKSINPPALVPLMSGSYAQRLSPYPNRGDCGRPELVDPIRVRDVKIKSILEKWSAAKKVSVLTGAGISTSAGVPDFRSPFGIWTAEADAKRKKKRRKTAPSSQRRVDSVQHINLSLPTYTHMALVALAKAGRVQHVSSQNVDGLHLRSGLPRNVLSELHGNLFKEVCHDCWREHVRDFDLGCVGCKRTGRFCLDCGAELYDTTLDWDDELPTADYEKAIKYAEESDLYVCLGTSLQMDPCRGFPTLAKEFVICNLQRTDLDSSAVHALHMECDAFMNAVMNHFSVSIDPYDIVVAGTLILKVHGSTPRASIIVGNKDCESCDAPWVQRIETVTVDGENVHVRERVSERELVVDIPQKGAKIACVVRLHEGCGCQRTTVTINYSGKHEQRQRFIEKVSALTYDSETFRPQMTQL